MIQWARLQLNGGEIDGKRLISEKNVEEMHTPQMAMRPEDAGRDWNPEIGQLSYGLGWFLVDYRGLHLVSHGGAIDGFRSDLTLVPREKTAVIVLCNLDQENLPEALRWSILDLMHGYPATDWNATLIGHAQERDQKEAEAAQKTSRGGTRARGTTPSHPLADYAGTYADAGATARCGSLWRTPLADAGVVEPPRATGTLSLRDIRSQGRRNGRVASAVPRGRQREHHRTDFYGRRLRATLVTER